MFADGARDVNSYFRHVSSEGYVHVYRRGSAVALYNSVNLNVAFLPHAPAEDGVDVERSLSPESLRRLRELGLDRHSGSSAVSGMLAELRGKALDEGVTTVYFIPAMACNYRCEYCQFIQEFDETRHYAKMTAAQARQLVDEFYAASAQAAPNKRDFVFFGGEPFMAPDIVCETLRYIRDERQDHEINIIAFTNASLISEEMARTCAKNNVYMIVSIDGPAEVNDRARVDLQYKPSFFRTLRGYRRLQRAGCKIGISVMAGTHNVDNLAQSVQWLIDHLQPDELGIAGVFHPLNSSVNPYQADPERVISALVETYVTCRDRGVYLDQVARRLRPFVDQVPKLKDCMACGGKMIATPMGMQGSCEYIAFLKTSPHRKADCHSGELVQLGIPGDNPTDWNQRSPMRKPDCQNCPALGVCGGGCPYNGYQLSGSLDALEANHCNQTRLFLAWMLEDLYEHCDQTAAGDSAELLIPTRADRQAMFGTVDPLDSSLPLKAVSRHGERK
jgi:uncharacterized protein